MTKPHYQDESITLYHGDCLDILAQLPDASVDSVVTDPPYGLEFMGKEWDRFGRNTGNGYREKPRFTDDHMGKGFRSLPNHFEAGQPFQQWCELWARECLRVLKPGGHLLAFGGTRTWHRLACAVEDAGFEIRDNIAWLYGSGFPKSVNVAKAIDRAAGQLKPEGTAFTVAGTTGHWIPHIQGTAPSADYVPPDPVTDDAKRWAGWGTALKPAFEPVVVARKPLAGTVAANVLAHGVGAFNIDATRIPTTDKLGGGHSSNGQQMQDGWKRPWMDDPEAVAANAERSRASVAKSEALGRWPSNVVIDGHAAAEIDRQSGITKDGKAVRRNGGGCQIGDGNIYSPVKPGAALSDVGYGGEGGASRFFPTFRYQAKAATDERPTANGIAHPTVKPLDLMRWLVRLVTPPGGTVLEPFAGSGTTAEACIHEHMKCIAIERETDYLPLIVKRLTKPIEIGFDFTTGTE